MRAEGCTDENAWLEVLSVDLRLVMPITPYRSFNPADVVNNRRVLLGVDGESPMMTPQNRLWCLETPDITHHPFIDDTWDERYSPPC